MSAAKAKALSLFVDPTIYPLGAVRAAAEPFADRALVRIEEKGSALAVTLQPAAGADRAALRGGFFNELLHQALRLRVSASSRTIREYIVTRALVSARPASPEACPECAEPGPAPRTEAPELDKELEQEIDSLLAALEKEGAADPLSAESPSSAAPSKPRANGKPDAVERGRRKAEGLLADAVEEESHDGEA